MKLVRFDYVDDAGALHTDVAVNHVQDNLNYGCGIYTFEKRAD